MGCTQSVQPRTPKKEGRGQWVDEGREPTLVEKWIQFRDWVRRNHGKKTKVIPIQIKLKNTQRVDISSTSAIPESGHWSIRTISSPASGAGDVQLSGKLQDGQSEITVAQWLLQHEITMETQGYSPVPGMPTKMTRPKAAKGKRTVVPPLEDISTLPGSVLTDQESVWNIMDGKIPSKGKCLAMFELDGETCLPVESEMDTNNACVNESKNINSGGIFRKPRPKAAKGKRTVSSFYNQKYKTKGAAQDCLDAWMRRQLVREGQE